VLGQLFGLAQMALNFVYRNPKKNGAVSELQQVVVAQAAADAAEKEQQQQQQVCQSHHVVAPATVIDADGEVEAVRADDGANKDDVVVDIMPPLPPLPAERRTTLPTPLPPPAVIFSQPRAVEVV
jgi:solute carrier family 50 protein (sugar transporter)